MYIAANNIQSIWDLAYKYYGTYNGVKQLIIDNPDTLNYNDPIAPGALIKITTFVTPINETAAAVEPVFLQRYEIVRPNQSLWDLAIQYYGTYDAAAQLILDNPGKLDFNNDIAAGTRILITQESPHSKMVDYLVSKGIKPSTAMKGVSNWILAYGSWDDAGIWIDNDIWND